jgi:uncharacterized membrane protein
LRNTEPTAYARACLLGAVALALVCVLWETVLAPLRPGGSWLALKALPLALLLPAASRGNRKALQGLSLLLPFYFAEGMVRGFSESGRHAVVAWFAAAIAAATFVAVLAWIRIDRKADPSAISG